MIPFLFGLKQKVLSVGAFFIAIINSITFAWPALGFACLIIWLFSTGYLLGSRWHPNGTRYEQTFIGSLMLLSATSIFGSVAYYAGSIPKSILVLLLGGLTLICIFVAREAKAPPSATKSIPRSLTLVIATMVCLAAWWIACFDVAILESIRSPWLVLNPFTISALGLAAAFMSAMILRGSRKAALPLFIFVLLSALGLAAAIYPLGYGFDPFIHRATVEHIAQFGTITPKPLYYIGEYILELCGALIFSLPLKVFDAWLVPVLSSILLTGSAWIGFGKEQRTGILALLFVPLSAFISTTPQSLAYVLTASLLFLSLPLLRKEKTPIPLSILWMLAVAAISTHPLAGIPAFIYTTLVSVCISNIARHLRILLSTLIALIGSVALPFIFAIQAQISGLAMSFSPEGLWDISRVDLTSFFDNRYSTWLDGMYLFIENQLWILLLFATISVVLMRRMRNNHLPLLAALMWFVNFWFLSTTLEFSFLIEYERANYADRLLVMTMIFLLPTLGMLIAEIIRRLEHQPAILRSGLVVLLALCFCANVYGAYPRHDNYARSAGFNVSENDFSAVYAIHEAGDGEDFIVLANQAVSSAALETFGFKTYYNGDIFYYPIPTGGKLYHYYLQMVEEEPSRETMLEAMNFTGVDSGFFVVNDYWWQADIIREHAKNTADEWFAVGEDDAVMVFIYRR